MSQKAPFLNPDPLSCWCGPENISKVEINDESSWALLDNGSTINAVTPEFIKAHSLDVGHLSNLVDGTLKINGFGGLFSWPLGYVIIRVQVEGVKGYNKEQVALVIPDLTAFGLRVLVTLSTPAINQIMNVIKESKMDELPVSLNGLRISHLLAGHQVELSLQNNTTTSQIPGTNDLNEAVKTMKWEEIAFLSKIVHGCTKTVLLGNNMYVMTQASEKGKEPCLPVNTYTEMTTGSRCLIIVIKNQMAVPIIIGKGIKVTLVVAANRVPLIEVMPGTLEKSDEMQGVWKTKMPHECRKETLLQQ